MGLRDWKHIERSPMEIDVVVAVIMAWAWFSSGFLGALLQTPKGTDLPNGYIMAIKALGGPFSLGVGILSQVQRK